MSRKVVAWVCGECGAELRGIGDWVEHDCLYARRRGVAYGSQRRRSKSAAHASDVHDPHTGTNRIMIVSDQPRKTFEQLLTAEDRAWIREIEKAFTS